MKAKLVIYHDRSNNDKRINWIPPRIKKERSQNQPDSRSEESIPTRQIIIKHKSNWQKD